MIHADTVIACEQLQQEPLLFLSDTEWVLLSAYKTSRQSITQPSPGTGQNFNVFRLKTYLFIELPVHGLFRRFSIIDSPLGELPCVLSYTPRPKDLTVLICEDNTDVWSESI